MKLADLGAQKPIVPWTVGGKIPWNKPLRPRAPDHGLQVRAPDRLVPLRALWLSAVSVSPCAASRGAEVKTLSTTPA